MISTLDLSGIQTHLSNEALERAIQANASTIARVTRGELGGPADRGWFNPSRWENDPLVDRIEALAAKVRSDAEVFLLVGVGGSNRGAQSVIEALGDSRVEILYTGDNLSSQAMQCTLNRIQGRSVYVNVIARDFNTLEPGVAFRFVRQYLESAYGAAASKRIIVTGSEGDGQLCEFARALSYEKLPFPADMGGRFSVISAVGLLPMAVAGVDIRRLIAGAVAAERELRSMPASENPACRYAVARNLLFDQGFGVENLVIVEPSLVYFARWWAQLFGESEGKNQRCIFPTYSQYSEDLHAIGQYIQQGRRFITETFLDAGFRNPDLTVRSSQQNDGFAYLDGQSLDTLNAAMIRAAFSAHCAGGVPCFRFRCGAVTPELFGELFYLFQMSCVISAALIDVDPYGQPGVEAYKQNMYRLLGK